MRKNSFFTKTKGMMSEYFIADLLNGNITDNTVVEERIKYLDWTLQKNFCVVVIIDKQFSKENTPFANTLHIHRNTLTYRIIKISEIMGVDITDSILMLHLHISFKILEHLNFDSDAQEGNR